MYNMYYRNCVSFKCGTLLVPPDWIPSESDVRVRQSVSYGTSASYSHGAPSTTTTTGNSSAMPPAFAHLTNINPTKLASRKGLLRRNMYAGTRTPVVSPTKHTLPAHDSESPPRGGSLPQMKDHGYGVLEQPEYYEVDTDPQSATPPYDFPRKSGVQLRYGCISPLPNTHREPADGPAGFAARGRR